jgi:hypothetical protein
MRSVLFFGIISVLVLGLVAGASAELFIAGGAGVALPQDQGVTFENPDIFGLSDLEPSDSVVVTGRGGYWLDNFPYIGFEGGAMVFFPDLDEQRVNKTFGSGLCCESRPLIFSEVDVISAHAVVLGRFPLFDIIHVYGGGGVAIQHVDFSNFKVNGLDVRADDDTFPAVQAQGGMKVFINENFGLFAEFIYTSGDIDTTIGGDGTDPRDLATIELEFDNMFIHGGIEYRFSNPFAK